ncbi:hypothetical protein RHSIM_Rhsim05G0212700 [Rhododendron simsii]|uniref:Clathrin light chain n=1 Tax=Rhododendron simsii TaxID=118357 RepID=A0A834GZJ8_RHOSS|nr:hypothetical protein RHSIM_Rhsim05G0212700 [Rhododendron simsii]
MSSFAAATPPFDDDGGSSSSYADSRRFDSFSNFADGESAADDDGFSPERNGDGGFVGSNGPILPPPAEMESEEGFALKEWRRLNAIRLEEKEKREKELLREIIEQAEEYKIEFYRRRKLACESNKVANREKEKLFLEKQETFHGEANKSYWKAIAELIPNEVATIEKRGKKEKAKQPSIAVIQGPKPDSSVEETNVPLSFITLFIVILSYDNDLAGTVAPKSFHGIGYDVEAIKPKGAVALEQVEQICTTARFVGLVLVRFAAAAARAFIALGRSLGNLTRDQH